MGKKLTKITGVFFVLMVISIVMFFTSIKSKSSMSFGISLLAFCVFLFLLLICGMIGTADEEIKYYKEKHQRRYHICNSCRYEWMSKKIVGRPSKCPNCNSKNIDRYANNFCSSCNAKIESDDQFCPECGKKI